MLRNSLVFLLLVLSHTNTWGASAATQLFKSCTSYDKVSEVPVNSLHHVYNAGSCAGFIAGIWFTNEGSCAPEGTRTHDAIKTFQEFVITHPEIADAPAADIVQLSQWEKWPCKKQNIPRGKHK